MLAQFSVNVRSFLDFEECLKDSEKVNHGYVVLNNSSKNRHDELRVSFNIFGEFKRFGPFPIFYVDN